MLSRGLLALYRYSALRKQWQWSANAKVSLPRRFTGYIHATARLHHITGRTRAHYVTAPYGSSRVMLLFTVAVVVALIRPNADHFVAALFFAQLRVALTRPTTAAIAASYSMQWSEASVQRRLQRY